MIHPSSQSLSTPTYANIPTKNASQRRKKMDSWTITLIVLSTLISLAILAGIATILCRCIGNTISAATAATAVQIARHVRSSRHVRSWRVQQSPEDGVEFANFNSTGPAIPDPDLEAATSAVPAATFAANSARSASSARSSQATIWPDFRLGRRETRGTWGTK